MVFRILPPEFRAKARTEGPSGKRALRGLLVQKATEPRVEWNTSDSCSPTLLSAAPIDFSLPTSLDASQVPGDRCRRPQTLRIAFETFGAEFNPKVAKGVEGLGESPTFGIHPIRLRTRLRGRRANP